MSPFRIARPRFLAYFAVEGGLIFAVLYGLAVLTALVTPKLESQSLVIVVPAGALFTALLLLTQWRNPSDRASLTREIVVFSLTSVTIGIVAFASTWLFFTDQRRLTGLLLLEGAVVVPLTVALWRWISTRYAVFGATRERVLIVGSGETARRVCRLITDERSTDYAVMGFAARSEEEEGTVLAMGVRVQTHYAALSDFALRRVDRVIVALDEKRGTLPVRQLMELRLHGVEIEEATSFLERACGKISIETMLPSWLIFSEGFKTTRMRSFLKRSVDIVHSVVLLTLTAPLMLLTAVLIKLDSHGPVFYRQSRLGQNGHNFELLKFRSMTVDAEMKSGPTWALENDPRVTRVGRIIRQLRIDELPQLVNVLKGEMSFVGPRPERAHFASLLEQKIPYYGLRLVTRPGLTGWAQVEYRYGASEEDALEKLKYDLYHIKNGNLLFDLWIVLKTIKVVLLGSGAR
jgi:sugar transferase (PEP-CTERM system associated)